MNKRFLTYDEQINKLKSNVIIIDDEKFAIKCLKEISYFALISGYKDFFRNQDTKNILIILNLKIFIIYIN